MLLHSFLFQLIAVLPQLKILTLL